MTVYPAHKVDVARKGYGDYVVYVTRCGVQPTDIVHTKYSVRYCDRSSPNSGLWEVRDLEDGALVGVEQLKRHAIRLISEGVY